MGIFSWLKKVDKNYKKNTKLGKWAVKTQKKHNVETVKKDWEGVKDAAKDVKEALKEESDQEETSQTSEEDKEGK